MNYGETFLKLTYETATIIFIKTNGDVRVMLGTRNIATASLSHGYLGTELAGHDKRCSINNGNIAIIDLLLGETRSFNINRLVSIEYHGNIATHDEMQALHDSFKEFKHEYEQNRPQKMNMDDLTD